LQKRLTCGLDEVIWDIKRRVLAALPEASRKEGGDTVNWLQTLVQAFNYGLFLPPCDGRAGKFLLEDRPLRDYPFHDCVPYLEVRPQFD
jgi:SH3/ankyrin repeat-containing protein